MVSDAEFPFALAYFTGSKEHNIVMRQRAIQRGLRLNEYGLFKSKEETRDPKLLVPCKTEEEIFAEARPALCPAGIARRSRRICRRRKKNDLPRLVEWTRFERLAAQSLQLERRPQTRWRKSPSFMHELGLRLLGDHRPFEILLSGERPRRRRACASKSRKSKSSTRSSPMKGSDFRLLTGTEVDILDGGKLDFDDDLLAELDVVVASVHQGFSQSEAENTKR